MTGRTTRRNDYRIEKDTHPVTVTLVGGERIMGAMFVQAYARHRSAPEDPWDILNEPEPFFPLLSQDGETLLLAKSRVMEVSDNIPSCRPGVTGPHTASVSIAITLVGGEVRTGRVYLEMPGPAPRPLDFLNQTHDRFFALHGENETRLINRELIERVHPLD